MPPESGRWMGLVASFADIVGRAGYGLVVDPVFEEIGVFERVGHATDVVRKEMYDFHDKGGRHLALRPEGTASLVRAYVQHRPPLPFKAWYLAPMFRYERPQAGRYRQHHQMGVEALGSHDPDLDVEVIELAASLYRQVGLSDVDLVLNSLGDEACRPGYFSLLATFLEERSERLCDEHRERASENPLRVLDCKRPACREATFDAPATIDHLCTECAEHFGRVQDGLNALGVAHRVEPRLVRGLDYYTRTTFEFCAQSLDTAQNGIGGGGRYDGLVEALGGQPTPGIGFGMGLERILLACDAEDVFPEPPTQVDVWVVDTAGGTVARDLSATLRRAGIGAGRSFDGRSMKSQFRAADRSGARLAIVVGEQEQADATVTVRDMREGTQESIAVGDAVAHVRKLLS